MNIVIFDTETVSLNKPFCYNVGYIIIDTDTKQALVKKDFVVEQVWHDKMLFATAHYANKRPLYVSAMKGRRTKMKKFGAICKEMIKDFKAFNVSSGYAYNSSFDEKVFTFNCEWFKKVNPFDDIPVFDIRGYVHNFIANTVEFKAYCEEYEKFTENGNYSTTAETLFGYINNTPDFKEAHTALADSEIETEILFDCLARGGALETAYKTSLKVIRRK